ncbi:hypothetical protein Purlil1_1960 [Purpureocillium lilacinum]|uniref:Uncharacterized protein n=1 Tax=Purpureocillium lilacinum TaxID=33203 RepID=A0ABR0CBB6_PURLI|nr:hypothetical protein Purlil1_1960 [Purpureocillium lilacinum]
MVARPPFCWASGPGDLNPPHTQHCELPLTHHHAPRPMASPSQPLKDAFNAGPIRYTRDVRGAPPTRALPALPVVERHGHGRGRGRGNAYGRGGPALPPSYAPRPVKAYRPLPPIRITKFDVGGFERGANGEASVLQDDPPDTSALLGFGPRGTLMLQPKRSPPPPLPPKKPFHDSGLPSPAWSNPRTPAGPNTSPPVPNPPATPPLSAADSGYESQHVEMIDVYMAPACDICHQYDALSTGFCFRCEHLWQSAVTGCSTFIPRESEVPKPDPAAVARASKRATAVTDARSSAWSSHVSSVLSLFGEEFDPGLPMPYLGDFTHYSVESTSLMVEPLRIPRTPAGWKAEGSNVPTKVALLGGGKMEGVKKMESNMPAKVVSPGGGNMESRKKMDGDKPPTKIVSPVAGKMDSGKMEIDNAPTKAASPIAGKTESDNMLKPGAAHVTEKKESGQAPTKGATPVTGKIDSGKTPTKGVKPSGKKQAVSEPDFRRLVVPERLQKRSLVTPPKTFDPDRLSEAARSLLPGAPTRKPEPRSAESHLYATMSYYFDVANFKKAGPIKVVDVRPVPPMVVQGLKRMIHGGARNWI